MFLGNIFWFADRGTEPREKKIQKHERGEERFWQSGNHKEQRTGFNNKQNSFITVFFLVFPNERRIFTHVEKRGRERGKTARREKSHSTPRHKYTTRHTNVDNRRTHTRSARARKRRRRKVLRLTRTDRGRGSSSSEKQEHTHAHT